MTVRTSVNLEEQTWRKLKDVAELRRLETGGRPNVGALIATMVQEALERSEKKSGK